MSTPQYRSRRLKDGVRTERLREAMKARGVQNAPQLAKLCDLVDVTARSYINGSRQPSLEACVKIGKGLNYRAEWLYEGKLPKENGNGGPIAMTTPLELIFEAIEEAFLMAGIAAEVARAAAGRIQLVVAAHPAAPPGMSQKEAVRRLIQVQLADLFPPKV